MITIIQGNKDVLKKYKYFKCRTCDWAGKAQEGEYKLGDQREPDAWMTCPCCRYAADEVTKPVEIAELIKQEKMNSDLEFREHFRY